jgi:hypothetical protein
MPTTAYLANLFPSTVEPYVVDEIRELRRRGITVAPCSARNAKPVSEQQLLAAETLYLQPLQIVPLFRALWLCATRLPVLIDFLRRAMFQNQEPPSRRFRASLHTLLGVYYAVLLKPHDVQIAMVAARLLGVGFSMTLHGSDLLLDAAFLDLKLSHAASA